MPATQCQAFPLSPPHYLRPEQCDSPATRYHKAGVELCDTHYRWAQRDSWIADRWRYYATHLAQAK